METYIKYKRFEIVTVENEIQEFLDNLVKEGWQIISYNEIVKSDTVVHNDVTTIRRFFITVLAGKKQDNSLSRVL
jgi:hypothetical protein